MDKKQLTVATAALLFSTAGVATVSADEITETPVDSSVPAIVTSDSTTSGETVVQSPLDEQPVTETPIVDDGTTPVVPSETVPTTPTEPSVPTTPTETPVVPTEPVIPTDPTVPTIPSTGTEGSSSTETGTTEPVSPTTPSSTDTVVGVSPTKPADPIVAPTPAPIEAPEDTPVEGQVVATVSEEAPIVTDTGYTIVSTDQGRVVIENLDGTTSLVAPEQIGGTLNIDGTISVKNNSGSMTTLPNTGVEDTIFLVALGLFILALLGFSTIREDQDNWAVVV